MRLDVSRSLTVEVCVRGVGGYLADHGGGRTGVGAPGCRGAWCVQAGVPGGARGARGPSRAKRHVRRRAACRLPPALASGGCCGRCSFVPATPPLKVLLGHRVLALLPLGIRADGRTPQAGSNSAAPGATAPGNVAKLS